VFAANAGLIYKNTFIPSEFKHPQRQVEEPYFQHWFESMDFDIPTRSRDRLSFEGAGDALFSSSRKILWMGFGHRTSGDYKFYLDTVFEDTNVIVRPLQLVDPRWYHLDTCFCPLDSGELLWYPPAFSPEARAVIELWYEDNDIKVSEEDALAFACNAVSVGDNIIVPRISEELESTLTDHGYYVTSVDMSQFLRSGGACKCLTIEVVE
jgi:N-dimethylarginine dimethylaminohydrolase